MNTHASLRLLAFPGLALTLLTPATAAEPSGDDWYVDASLYGLAAGMSGDVSIGSITADADLPFDKILENLEMCAMGSLRIGRGDWALTTDLVYMGLGTAKNGVTIDMDQLIFEPTVSRRLNERVELLAGGRFVDMSVTLRGPGVFPNADTREADASWWDAIVGTNLTLPFAQDWAITLRADIGAGASNLTWQAFPGVSWYFSPTGALQLGYRWAYVDYETGSGVRYFHYDMMNEGPQVGVRFHF